MKPAPLPLARILQVLRAEHLVREVVGQGDVSVYGVSQDSRHIRPGDLFLAWAGTQSDAHAFVASAVERGAAAVIVERPVEGVDVPQIVVSDGRRAGAIAADLVFGSPWRELDLVAITGTNGKTTTASLTRHLLGMAGPAASLGTLGVVDADGRVVPGTERLTTPGPVDLGRWLRHLADSGVKSVALEASSHALDQHRLDGICVDTAVFTNLSQDHLDYHGTMEAYRAAKLRLVDRLAAQGSAVVNAADPAWDSIDAPRTLRFAVEPDPQSTPTPDLAATRCQPSATGTRFDLTWQGRSETVDLPLPGHFNVENATAAAGVALLRGHDLAAVADRLGSAPPVPGRLERVVTEPFAVLIDFAHTPEALDRVLSTLRPTVQGRLVVLFGAGGDRDRTKRAPMARAVARWADRVWLTSDNPRSEDPESILDDLAQGLGGVSVHRQVDRRRAIEGALSEARPGDVVVLAGKGHERTQTIDGVAHDFDERAIVLEALAAQGMAS
jgi:UDP-N-acetylmuramoyl-L-alanyl-D-glutamate--2,6-diaminopimelate ligase